MALPLFERSKRVDENAPLVLIHIEYKSHFGEYPSPCFIVLDVSLERSHIRDKTTKLDVTLDVGLRHNAVPLPCFE